MSSEAPIATDHIKHLEMIDIVKTFPGVRANDGITLDVKSGEVHALLGENGAGKSTLMRQLYGMFQPDSGEIRINGEAVQFRSPASAIKAGIGMIHQHFMLVDSMTVAQNVALGRKSTRGLRLDLDVVSKEIRRLSADYGLAVDPDAYVWQLSVGEQQRVEILKALYVGASLIILDEPTAVLTPGEVDDLFVTLRRMVKEGHSLLFISHKLHEVMAVSDRATVLRDGATVGTRITAETTRKELVNMMVGREIQEPEIRLPKEGPISLKVEDLHARGDRGNEVLKGLDLEIKAGEILGLAGVSGNGQKELAECLVGMRESTGGTVRIHDKDVTHLNMNDRVEQGLSFVPEERMKDGAIGEFSVWENVFLRDHSHDDFCHGIFLNQKAMHKQATKLMKEFSVKTPALDTPLKTLSGGNIQKLILARELSRDPSVLIAAQPTRGVDIGASEYIHQTLVKHRDLGTAILLISEDLDEIRTLSDRVAVIYDGRIVGIMNRDEAEVGKIGSLMASGEMSA
ncbi:MAG: ABC transporter ATP-binding protein [Spirochaetales bacterium]|nr:ABC transporter ATP-binding protein [Spirochaetales bacterium]